MTTDNYIIELNESKENASSLHLRCKVLIALSMLCIFSSIVNAEPSPEDANLAGTLIYKPNSKTTSALENDLLITKIPISDISRKLWKDRTAYLTGKVPYKSGYDLEVLIKKVSSIEFRPKDQTPEPIVTLEPVKNDNIDKRPQTNETAPEKMAVLAEPQGYVTTVSENQIPSMAIKSRTLQIFKDMTQKPEQLQHPFELAEILFNSHCLPEAAKCYRQALDRIAEDNTAQHSSKAWILFQIGNCLQNDDPETAIQMYKQLTHEFPDSPWADLGHAKKGLIDWYEKNKPDTLINQPKLQASLPKTEYPKVE